MKLLTISSMHNSNPILLYLNHEVKNISYYYTKKVLLSFNTWYIHLKYVQKDIDSQYKVSIQ